LCRAPVYCPMMPALAALARSGFPVWSEIELAWAVLAWAPHLHHGLERARPHHILDWPHSGNRGVAGANRWDIGTAADIARGYIKPRQLYSGGGHSFQLESISASVRISPCSHVTPDHPGPHGSVEAYGRKGRLFENQRRRRCRHQRLTMAVAAAVCARRAALVLVQPFERRRQRLLLSR